MFIDISKSKFQDYILPFSLRIPARIVFLDLCLFLTLKIFTGGLKLISKKIVNIIVQSHLLNI